MAKYDILWNDSNKTMTITKSGARTTKGNIQVSHLILNEDGEVAHSESFPQPDQHIKNVAMTHGIENFSLVTVVNKSGNEFFDKLEQTANPEAIEADEREQEAKILDNPKIDKGISKEALDINKQLS
jgi:hypothetical protein